MAKIEMTDKTRAEHTVMIVDDEPHIRRLIQVNLERAGYKTVQASDGQQCLDDVAKEHPDLILLDWMMPIKDGMETIRELQADDETVGIPVVFLTAKGQDDDIFKGWNSGAWSYITKPFNPREVLTFIDRIMLSKRDPSFDQDESQGTTYNI
jgi:two-component system alkaline phosphatase synthesis response regulator PhoP